MRLLCKIYSFFTGDIKRKFWLLLAQMLFLSMVETITVGVISLYAALISDPESTHKAIFSNKNPLFFILKKFYYVESADFVAISSLVVVLVVVFRNGVRGFLTYRVSRFSSHIESFLGGRVLTKIIDKPYGWHVEQNGTQLVQLVNWRSFVGRNATSSYLRLINETTVLIVILLGVLCVKPFIGLLFIIFQGGAGFIIYLLIRKKLNQSASSCRDSDVEQNRWVARSIYGIKDVKISNTKHYFVGCFKNWSEKYSEIFSVQQFWKSSPLLALESIGFVMITGAILFMLMVLDYSPLEVTGTTALLAITAWRTLPAFNKVVSSVAGLKTAVPYVEKFIEHLDPETGSQRVTIPEKNLSPIQFSSGIFMKNVSFSYPEGPQIFSDFSLDIPCGSSLGIMGPSGCGKSTLIDLLTGLLTPTSGAIFIDGLALDDQNLPAWLDKIAYVPQSPFIFDGTLAENVAFGVPRDEVDTERVQAACRLAAVDFLHQLPSGIHSYIGDRGIKLSGGQRQRISIARALYKDSSVIIFDEATSALDEQMDNEIKQLITALRGEKTIIVISHRPSTIKGCEKVIELRRLSDNPMPS